MKYDLRVLKGSLEVAIRLSRSGNELARSCFNDTVIANMKAEYERQAEDTFNADDFPAITQIYLEGVYGLD